ncbi:MAG: dihydropteroate synthase [Prevotella sp.]|nr:dihydropteroate synthase [Prevotella sp.]
MNNQTDYSINVNGRLMIFDVPKVMGILNVTPDSFYAGSRKQTERDIAKRVQEITEQGGDIIDIGAFSTRPGAARVSEEDEINRLRGGLDIVCREAPGVPLSVDTFRPDVARMAVEEYGVAIINDVSEGNVHGAFGSTAPISTTVGTASDDIPPIFAMAGKLGVPYILMSVRATLNEMIRGFAAEVELLHSAGVKDIILDPGFGFGKTVEQNHAILAEMDKLQVLGLPVLAGLSRKSMIFKPLGITPDESLNGTTVLNTLALARGAAILRVHDVREAVECVRLMELQRQS